jgi:acetyltransferase-like isoleucine patch superfamily enzyme
MKTLFRSVLSHMVIKIFFIIMPSKIKIYYYRLLGAKIGRCCYIGLSIVDAGVLQMDDYTYIGHFNLIWRLKTLTMGRGSRITMLNWITGARQGIFQLGANSSISIMHFIEASADIKIGANTIIAGRSSQFFTHGITPTNLDDQRAIIISDWCYVGSAARFTPGSCISDHTFVGMGAVITKQIYENYVLIGGSPARVIKNLSKSDLFFKQPYLSHSHHPGTYEG